MSLIVTGTIGIDTVHTPTGSVEEVPGGSCAYFAAAASSYTSTRLVAAVGDDWPEGHRDLLSSFSGIDMAGLETRVGSKTFRWGGRYLENLNDRETLFTDIGVLAEAPPAIPEAFRDSQVVFLANTHPSVQLGFLEHLPERRFTVADTMDLWINTAKDELLNLLSVIDGVVINDSEALLLTGIRNPIDAARAIMKLGPSVVVVKKGEHGAVLASGDELAVLPAYPADAAQVVDPTGCGDSFAGGMMGWLAARSRWDFPELQTAIAWGTVSASFTLGAFALDGLRDLDMSVIEQRMIDYQAAARVGEQASVRT
ncbi:MAG: PfkB family carbohydrate kinase [Planctomycetota bacterium]|nr:PfkB family carbohydrate kinase [Planctomycetota bacterium]